MQWSLYLAAAAAAARAISAVASSASAEPHQFMDQGSVSAGEPCWQGGCRVILAYDETSRECASVLPPTLFPDRRRLHETATMRKDVLALLGSRISEALASLPDDLARAVEKSTLSLEQVTPRLSETFLASPVSVLIESKYLPAVAVEIVNLPAALSSEDGVQLAQGLPCVVAALPDLIRTYTEEVVPDDLRYSGGLKRFLLRRSGRLSHRDQRDLSAASTESTEHGETDDYDVSGSITSDDASNSTENDGADDPNGSSDEDDVFASLLVPRHNRDIKWPLDPLLKYQWHYRGDHPYGTQAELAWNLLQNRTDHEPLTRHFTQDMHDGISQRPDLPLITVALIDSGCDLQHPDLQERLWQNPGETNCTDGVDDDGNGFVDDCVGWDFTTDSNQPRADRSGHGTAAAGVIAAHPDNNEGLAGGCWNCRLMCLKFIRGTTGRVSDQIAAIDYAITNNATISNNSYGGYGLAAAEYLVIRRARKAGHLFVASAGNNNRSTDSPKNPHSPSVYPLDNILAVGASTMSGKKATFSNWGNATVDVFAPGQSILTTLEDGGYGIVSGTSFAAPMTAAAAGVVWSTFPSLTYLQLIDALVGSCTPFATPAEGITRCNGILNLPAALLRARQIAAGNAQPFAAARVSPFSIVVVDDNDAPYDSAQFIHQG